ncbi:MAG: OmpA family protein [Burkholderiales bacterium]|nr:OmpA family protein [Burkholderiales bacterium]
MKFKLKKSLIGVAALSVLVPVASHADTGKGQYINDGFNRTTKDGRGSTCVSSGGADNAFDAANCASAAQEMSATAASERAARQAAAAEAAAAAQAAREEAMMAVEPGSALKPGEKGAYVSHGSAAPIRDGFGRACVKDGRWNPAMATEECDPDLHNLYRSKKTAKPQQELAPRLTAKPPEVVRAAPTAAASAAPAAAAAAAATGAAVAATSAADDDVIPAFVPPPGADDDDVADAVMAQDLAQDEEVTPDMMLSEADRTLPDDDAALLAAVPLMDDDADEADDAIEELAEDDEVTPDMMLSEADRTLADDEEAALVAALDDDEDDDGGPANDDGEDEDTTPDMMMSEADRTLEGEEDVAVVALLADDDDDEEDEVAAADDFDDEETTPDMMLAENDRRLDDEDIGMLAAIPTDDDDDDARNVDEDDDDETTPDMMLSDADRTLEGEEVSPGVATLTDTAPGVAPPPEKVEEAKPVIDNTLPNFPITKHEVADAAPAKKEAVPTSLPVTIDVKEDGLFDFDRAILKSDLVSKLDAVAAMLRDSKYEAINIVGHADPIGTESYNQGLSQRRAAAAKKYLVGKGIDASRINVTARGETDLVVARADCAGLRKQALIDCLQPNRRVVVEAAGSK